MTLSDAYAGLLDFCGLLAGATIGVLAVLVSVDVLIRNLGIGNFPWLLEVAEYALYVSTFLAAPWVLRLGAHVRVDLLLTLVPAAAARALEILVDALGAGISLVLLYYGLLAAVDSFSLGARIDKELLVTEWYLLAVIPISCALLAVEFALRIRRALAGDGALIAERAPKDGF